MNDETRTQRGVPERFNVMVWLKRYGLLVVLVIGLVCVLAFDWTSYLSYQSLQENHLDLQRWVAAHRLIAVGAYVAVYIALVSLSLPGGAFMTMVGGYLFGIWLGTLLAAGAASIGAIIIFIAARNASRDFIERRENKTIRRIEAGFKENMLSYMFFLRLVPVFPFFAVNLAMAFLGVPLKLYALTTFFGILPGSAVYASVGNGLGALLEAGQEPDFGIIFEPEILVPILLLALLSLVPIAYRRWRGKRAEKRQEES